MPIRPAPRVRGRPRTANTVLSAELIVLTAAQLVRSEGWPRLSMRSLAQALGVDPMALYHHVPGKAALLKELAAHQCAGMDVEHPPFAPALPWQQKLEALAAEYLQRIAAEPELVRILARSPAAGVAPARQFAALVKLALAELRLPPQLLKAATRLLADFLHGCALAPDAARRATWRGELGIIVAGLAALRSA